MKKFKFFGLLLILLLAAFLVSNCAKDTIEADRYGDIEGIVVSSDTDEGVANVNITTAPASNSILTDSDGSFVINNVPTGNYTIQARKNNYRNNSVSVAVREDQSAIARIPLTPDVAASEQDINAQVTSWFNNADGDSMFVDINYRVSNVSTVVDISEYEIYFEIETNSGTRFFFDIEGTNLKKGQSRSGEFTKFIQDKNATDVFVSDIWLPGN